MNLKCQFVEISQKIAEWAGKPVCFILACSFIIIWAMSGPLFGFSDTWQLVVNTSTTIITFIMVFLIQSTQNRDTEALHLKLDELIRANEGTHLALLDIEELDEDDFQAFRKLYAGIGKDARERMTRGESDMDVPELENPLIITNKQKPASKKSNKKKS